MSEFKIGDTVTRGEKPTSPRWEKFLSEHKADTYTVTSVLGSWVQLNNCILDGAEHPFFEQYFTLVKEVQPVQISKGWDYAEADRLEQAAKAAIKAYNEYIQRQPQKFYTTLYLPE